MKFYTTVVFLCTFNLSSEIDEFFFKDLRREFLERREERRKQDVRLKLLDEMSMSNNSSLTVDGIPHILAENKNNMEEAFKQMIIMKDAKYIYKRDFFWRTWRDVEMGGKREIVHYKCSNVVKDNCTRCDGGFWIIEEKPPQCPYEIFSTNSSDDICVFQYNSTFSDCSLRITKAELKITCNNYIETSMKITKKWKNNGRNTAVICQEREFCEITTLYLILPDSIIFRLINSTNHIIYSKIMKNNNNNYICLNNCGKFDPITKKVVDNDEPLSLNLFNNKKKREEMYKNTRLLPNGLHYKEIEDEIDVKDKNKIDFVSTLSKNTSSCNKIRKQYIRDENLSTFWDE